MPPTPDRVPATVVLRCSASGAGVHRAVRQLLRTTPSGARVVIAADRPLELERPAARRARVAHTPTQGDVDALVAAESAAGRTVAVLTTGWATSPGWLAEVSAGLPPGTVRRLGEGGEAVLVVAPGTDPTAGPAAAPPARAVLVQRRSPSAVVAPARRTLSAVLIVKDEEESLPACLAALVGAVDEVVVYDTGSTDATVAIARGSGATVVEGHWDDDFAAARNRALAHATGDWVLSVDADEVLEGDVAHLRSLVDSCGGAGMRVEVVSVSWSGGDDGVTIRAPRLFRRSGARWTGALHEQLVRSDGQSLDWDSAVPAVRLLHHGYTALKVQTRQKASRNVDIARAALERTPRRDPRYPQAVSNLGRSLVFAGRHEEGAAVLDELLDLPSSRSCIVTSSKGAFRAHLRRGQWDQAERWAGAAERSGESPGAVVVMRALVASRRGSPDEAVALLTPLVQAGPGHGGADVWGVPFPHHHAVEALVGIQLGRGAVDDAQRMVRELVTAHADVVDVALVQRTGRASGDLAGLLGAASEQFLERSLRVMASAAPEVCLEWCEAYAAARPLDHRPVVAAAVAAPHAGWDTALRWTLAAHELGLEGVSPLRDLADRVEAPALDRCMAWALVAEAFDEAVAGHRLVALLEVLPPERVDDVLAVMATTTPRTLGRLVEAAQPAPPRPAGPARPAAPAAPARA